MNAPPALLIRASEEGEDAWIERFLSQSWGAATIVSRGVAHDASRSPALIGEHGIPIHDELEFELILDAGTEPRQAVPTV